MPPFRRHGVKEDARSRWFSARTGHNRKAKRNSRFRVKLSFVLTPSEQAIMFRHMASIREKMGARSLCDRYQRVHISSVSVSLWFVPQRPPWPDAAQAVFLPHERKRGMRNPCRRVGPRRVCPVTHWPGSDGGRPCQTRPPENRQWKPLWCQSSRPVPGSAAARMVYRPGCERTQENRP